MLQKMLRILSSRKIFVSIVSAGVIIWRFSTPVMAVVITPGQTSVTPAGAITYSYGDPMLLIEDTGPVSFTGDYVYTNDPSSPNYGEYAFTGTLDTQYQFTNINSSDPNDDGDPINHFSISSFAKFLTDADYVAGSGTADNYVSTVGRNSQNNGDTVDFDFSGNPATSPVEPGSTSVQLVVDTNASAWYMGEASIQGGGNVSLAAPAPVPEPATAAIAGIALCALGMRRRNAARS
jgi:hypothetical protein